jgi:hypothetical protein
MLLKSLKSRQSIDFLMIHNREDETHAPTVIIE